MLFEVKKYQSPVATPQEDPALISAADQLAPGHVKLSELINLVDHGKTVHWISTGCWSMHHLLQKILEKTGPADLWISSYTFGETPTRTICDLKHTGIIKSLYCIIDSRVDVRAASALTMLRNACNKIKLCETHAKITVIKNDQWFLVVGGSANYSTNKRLEVGYVCGDAVIANLYQNVIINELTKL